jgi:hypothetical protein
MQQMAGISGANDRSATGIDNKVASNERVLDTGTGQAANGQKAGATNPESRSIAPSAAQKRYLQLGMDQPGGKLPLFDENGQEIKPATIRSCVEKGWAEPWFENPVKPGWLVCRLTENGRKVLKPGNQAR